MKSTQGTITSSQTSIGEWLVAIPRLPRLLLGFIPCATASVYLPILLMALFGVWINALTLWLANSIVIVVLAFSSLIGYKTGREYLIALTVAVVLDCYAVNLAMRTWTLGQWGHHWQNFFWINTAVPLNAYLFVTYKKAAAL